MPDPGVSQFTTVFRACEPRRIRRNRQPVSCTTCQQRKSRCDRRQPCAACERRGDAPGCHFGPSSGSRVEVQNRLSKLEALVQQLAEEQTGAQQNSHVKKDGVDVQKRPEDTSLEYRGPTSWAAVVDNIHDIQSALNAEDDDVAPESDVFDVDDIVCGSSKTTIDEVLQVLPRRTDVDKLISAYFNARFMSLPYIHTGQFCRQYEQFWADPASMSMLWISILFSILSCGVKIALVKTISLSSGPESRDASLYVDMAAKCLVTGQYLKARPHSVEALVAHVHSRNVQRQDSDANLWTFLGIIVRVAQRQGYHRPANRISPRITPFEAEMRRRVWFVIASYDLLWSIQQGLPPMIHEDTCDTDLPLNLADEDFNEDSVDLVPRSTTEPLPILAYITKFQMMQILRPIVRHALGVKPETAAAAEALGAALDNWHESIPACLKYGPICKSSFTEPSYTIYHRMMLEMTYHVSRCVLMRSFMMGRGQSKMGAHAFEVCRESALELISMQIEQHRETQPGGRLYEDRFMVSSLSLHSFLMASMILCLELKECQDMPLEERAHRTQILRSAQKVWEARSDTSADASHANKVLKAILDLAEFPGWRSGWEADTIVAATPPQEPEKASEHDAGSARALPPDFQEILEDNGQYGGSLPMESFFNDAEGIDWKYIDSYLRHDPTEIMTFGETFSFLGP